MVPGRHLALNGTKQEVTATEGGVCLKPPEGPLPEAVPICGGNAIALDLISSQPMPVPVPAAAEEEPQKSQPEPKTSPTCPQCGLQSPASRDLRRPQGSSLSVHSVNSRRSKSKGGSVATLNQPANAATTPGDWCFDLLLSCLFCHCSAVLLGLLDLCSFGLSSLCSCCAEGCSCCCSAVQDAPLEELNCHTHCQSVLVNSCCEPVEFLEFCLECCQICHRS